MLPVIEQDDIDNVTEVLRSGNLSGFAGRVGDAFLGGEKVKQFESDFASYFGVKYAVSFNSCTSALHAAMVACGVTDGDEVITTPFSFTASAKCALMVGAEPIFVDIKPDIFCIDPSKIEKRITPRTRAILPVHLFGHPADMDEIMRIATKYRLCVVEDAAQAIGSIYKNRYVGTIGDCGVFSFDSHKTITTGEGGMLITNKSSIAATAQAVRNHGEMLRSYVLGWNYRLTEFQAALGISQFKKLDRINQSRIDLCNRLTDRLSQISGIVPPVVYPFCKHTYFLYAVKVQTPRNILLSELSKRGIYFGKGYNEPLHLLPIYGGREGDCPIAERMFNEELIATNAYENTDSIVECFEDAYSFCRK